MYIKNVISLCRKATKITPTLYKTALCEENPIHLVRNLSVFTGTNKQLLGGTLFTLVLLLFAAYTVGKSQKLDVLTSFYLVNLKS